MEQNDSLAAVLERALKQAGRSEALAEELDATRAEMGRREGVLKQRLAAAENLFRTREEEMSGRIEALERTLAGRSPEDQVAAKADERARGMTAELHARLHQLQADLARAQAELLEARAEASDSKLKLSRLETERGTLATLTRQQEGEVVVLRGRLHELLASRWRRYGQKLHLCMTMPWEREMGNGKH
jgi:DNA repair exonuclease SbcCD ATPase subunit